MTDRISKERRSWLMGRVGSRNTSPELRVRSVAHSLGLRFRLHKKDLPGRPDIVFPKHKLAIFVHGCFWHRHSGCRKASNPRSSVEFWQSKFAANVARDARAVQDLEELGWRVAVIWECETRTKEGVTSFLSANIDDRQRDPT
ncbi:very short patch repair endonuclease [Tianweitania sediminis]|uniref:Very short patch repair endonuclease n=1 Tax=Tianweitania sediminis TaxID=1502156 RepID=A0A8J7UK62_9HYPH|nr:DNA mismatch endonuclease Vsr [Tianweitania sediminis]MBP0439560.1 DNA mismatch endonuclease Vsr [Tianweitania sediminis]